MIRLYDNLKLPASFGRPVATIGTFDGVHKGHQRVLADLRRWAKSMNAPSLVITFDRSPKTLTRGVEAPCITSLEHRLVLFERLGIDACLVLTFGRRLSKIPAEKFVRDVLCKKLRVRGVLLGFNCRFGRGAEGDFELLKRLSKEGLLLARESRRPAMAGDVPVSSSLIRKTIELGDLSRAKQMLGRPVALLGTVVHGLGRGASLGFPTANLDLHHEVKPPAGVYITEARVRGVWMPALTSIGRKPTFKHPPRETVVEVYIPELKRKIYGEDIEVTFLRKLRDQHKFDSVEQLIAQMQRDLAALKRTRSMFDKAAQRRGSQQ